MKILSLHAKFSSFFAVCFREAIESHGVQIRLVCSKPEKSAPFSNSIYEYSKVESVHYREDLSESLLWAIVEDFKPDAIITSGWIYSSYLKVCKKFRNHGGFVVAFSDTQFEGRLKQRIGCLLAPWVLKPSIDVICVAGERQRQYASMLGYRGKQVWEPMLCCDWDRFSSERLSFSEKKREFLYVGRMIEIKGFDILLRAYKAYQKKVEFPWRLRCIGGGELENRAKKIMGLDWSGFIQPWDLPQAMAQSGCFILPSRKESWGVALQEASCLGHPLIATDSVGASVHLLRDGWNGYLVDAENVESLLDAMLKIHNLDDHKLSEMGDNSFTLSKQYTPRYWAQQLIGGLKNGI